MLKIDICYRQKVTFSEIALRGRIRQRPGIGMAHLILRQSQALCPTDRFRKAKGFVPGERE